MNYEIVAIPNFRKELKKLSKKYPSLKEDFSDLIQSLQKTPIQGISLGKNCFKIRMSIKSKRKGKSGGARVISLVKINKNTVFLLSVYDKAEKENISNTELKALIGLIEGEEQE
ncbi:type II toxin-antitoxin system RelE/ParE family toxin [Algoriphagus sp. NF]|uniref:type II toxin-antitoxin system RelE/ParE family toxin n=2 Tax=Algoriphagus TaxID=246875 RepID=UPI00237B0A26|nr:type II toxin-antitoxin system RelE/ParE family toxin [Algoriphagus sp. NF]MDE0559290.1 type II toxin-antitoxin system RelE/ParE family toxin [Algoriphagus sp. NF]